ncbi:hypothetical protein, partial [Mesorhizobium sp.]|uniref:hypothetical protein n=1 Tax=Mesorhizobium sp. TaxID=1871066 RepID=UPI00258D0077
MEKPVGQDAEAQILKYSPIKRTQEAMPLQYLMEQDAIKETRKGETYTTACKPIGPGKGCPPIVFDVRHVSPPVLIQEAHLRALKPMDDQFVGGHKLNPPRNPAAMRALG